MSCRPDLKTLVGEIEMLIKDQIGRKLVCEEEVKPSYVNSEFTTRCKDESCTIKITLDIFVKLHQMLHNYIGLLNFSFCGRKSRNIDEMKIPLNEALDVAVRAMLSAMQSSLPKQTSPTRKVCLNCNRPSKFNWCQSGNVDTTKCELTRLSEVEEVDKKLERLKEIKLENVDNFEMCIKDVLKSITKLPFTIMASKFEILSSVVRNMKNKLLSCGLRLSSESLMGTQLNPISQIISEFILEFGQIKSQIFPCQKVCRFCSSVICPMDRQRDIFCCENARRLNFLWKAWVKKNSLKGLATWDEDTIMSIADSFTKNSEGEKKRHNKGSPCESIGKGRKGKEGSSFFGKNDTRFNYGDIKKKMGNIEGREQGKKMSSDFSRNGSRGLGIKRSPRNGRSPRSSEERRKFDRPKTGDRQNNDNLDKDNKKRDSKERGYRAKSFTRKNTGEKFNTDEKFDGNKTSRKKFLNKEKKNSVGGDTENFNADDYRNVKIDRRKKGTGSKKEGVEMVNDGGDQKVRKAGKQSDVESKINRRGGKNSRKGIRDEDEIDETIATGYKNKKDLNTKKSASNAGSRAKENRLEKKQLENIEGVTSISAAMKNLEKYGKTVNMEGNSVEGEKREVNSDNHETHEDVSSFNTDCKNIIQYQLSNDLYVELGWTLLPKDTIMRRVIEFQALVAKPHMNWFKNNRIHGKQFYCSDKKTLFLNFLQDGTGFVYYPNGQIAIAAQVSSKKTHEIYKVYAQVGKDVISAVKTPWLMAVFDSMGNGVVYDENCNTRLAYNQNGGVFVDNPAKVPFSWGWNNFQTFPIDEPVYEDPPTNQLTSDLESATDKKYESSRASKLSASSKEATNSENRSEFESVSEDQKSKTFETVKKVQVSRKIITPVKPICLKMNKYLSLRILDRRNINLQFFAGSKFIRIELGTDVNPKVQIKSELVDRNDWTKKMIKSRFDVNTSTTEINKSNTEGSLLEIVKEIRRAKSKANSRQLMLTKYRPQLNSLRSQAT